MTKPVLFASAAGRAVAFPVEQVVESMRPLPIDRLPGTPHFVRGVSLIRGEAVPVVDLGGLLTGRQGDAPCRRFVLLRVGDRRVALAVEDVSGVRDVAQDEWDTLPPLLGDIDRAGVDAIGARDAQLLTILDVARIIPDAVWAAMDARQTAT